MDISDRQTNGLRNLCRYRRSPVKDKLVATHIDSHIMLPRARATMLPVSMAQVESQRATTERRGVQEELAAHSHCPMRRVFTEPHNTERCQQKFSVQCLGCFANQKRSENCHETVGRLKFRELGPDQFWATFEALLRLPY
jgi:hypothetical protein